MIILAMISLLTATTTISGSLSFVNGPISNMACVKMKAFIGTTEYLAANTVYPPNSNTISAVFNFPANQTVTSIEFYPDHLTEVSDYYNGKNYAYNKRKTVNISTNQTNASFGSLSLTIINRNGIIVSQTQEGFRQFSDALQYVANNRQSIASYYYADNELATQIREYRIMLDKGRYAPLDMKSVIGVSNYNWPLLGGLGYTDLTIEGVQGIDPYNTSNSTVFTYPLGDNNYFNHMANVMSRPYNPLINVSGLNNSVIRFKKITFMEYYNGISITDQDPSNTTTILNTGDNRLTVSQCNFKKIANIKLTYYNPSNTYYGKFLKSNGGAIISRYPVTIDNSYFYMNSIYHELNNGDNCVADDEATCLGSAIYVDNIVQGAESTISYNKFEANQGRGGIVFVKNGDNYAGTSLTLEGNEFKNNYVRNPINITTPLGGFGSFYISNSSMASGLNVINLNTQNLTAKNNKFYSTQGIITTGQVDNPQVQDPYYTSNLYNGTYAWHVSVPCRNQNIDVKASVLLKANNNTLASNTFNGYPMHNILHNPPENQTTSISLKNNVLMAMPVLEYGLPFPYSGSSNNIGSYNYYHFDHESHTGLQNKLPGSMNNICKFVYPDPVDINTLEPVWDSYYRSLVIDNGHPDLNNNGSNWVNDPADRDPDGSRLDIGAVPAREHGLLFHQLSSNGSTNQYNWICFPYLDKRTTGTQYGDLDNILNVVHNYHDNNLLFNNPRYMEEMEWKYCPDNGKVKYENGDWQNKTKTLISQMGFKVKMMPNMNRTIEDMGFLCGTEGNADDVVQLTPNGETWVGYFKTQSEDPFYALSDIISRLTLIQTKNWSISRPNTSSPWTYAVRNPKINFGEMVVLNYIGPETGAFQWRVRSSGGSQTMAYTEPKPQNFTYNETADYISVYVKLNEDLKGRKNSNAELALFIDGVCYGAEVIQSDTVEVSVYLNEIPENADIEFRYWEPEMKSGFEKYKDYSTYQFDLNKYTNTPISYHPNSRFYLVSLNKADMNNLSQPQKTILEGNYPNPFNPETSIRYQLSEKTHVSLKIFNVKGQLVKTLINNTQDAGYKKISWNGKDNDNKAVASGIYFYTLETPNSSTTKKMMLMK